MKSKIENITKCLINEELIEFGRAADLVWFSFGKEILIKNSKGSRKKNKYSIHIQCPWRLSIKDKVKVASYDIYLPIDSNIQNFNWEEFGSNIFDNISIKFLQNQKRNYLVKKIVADKFGGLKIIFNKNLTLEIFTNSSQNEEFWRFIKFGNKSKHFVIGSFGVVE
ncbi:hypothetical protein NUH30_19270 [Leptospira sp. 85282-16]|uniref:hypothetical protein n=1 Tax=Leptospira sp. 85282-16 TaxID=2971256 RepID=UPI0021C0579E|nr:hypothetical protein [Leptospira sp. 85282-16]MCT8335836.1 hypothetical protein [Leptospira sp. 85282-16]